MKEDGHARHAKEILDILKQIVLEKEIDNYWNDPLFLKLIKDPDFQAMLDSVCQRAMSHFKVSSIYSCEDLKQDVLARFGKWLPHYRGDAQLKTVLRRVAYSQLVDVHRNPNERCCSFDSLELEQGDAVMPRSNVAADIESGILVEECLSKLDAPEERDLFIEYFVNDKTVSEIARERGVSRQAVSKRFNRLAKKLKPFM
jgi:RNA polymerase sigma factor (sigma-70 family)